MLHTVTVWSCNNTNLLLTAAAKPLHVTYNIAYNSKRPHHLNLSITLEGEDTLLLSPFYRGDSRGPGR